MMNLMQHEYQGIPTRILVNGNGDLQTCNSSNTQKDSDKVRSNQSLSNGDLCANDSFDVCPTEYFPFINAMTEIDLSYPNRDREQELHEKIQIHKKSSSSGFNSLQKRIEKVKNDIKNLTSKLKPDNLEESSVKSFIPKNGICNIVTTTVKEDEINEQSIECEKIEKSIVCEKNGNTKILNSSSESIVNNRFSDLSENTQKILGRFHLTEDKKSVKEEDDDLQVEMEEDEIEFSFSIRSNSLLNDFLLRTPMPVIDEDEDEYSSSEESASIIDNKSVPRSSSLHSFDVTEGDSYRTAIASSLAQDNRHGSISYTDEFFSDLAKCSVSTSSLTESMKSQEFCVLENTCDEFVMDGENNLKEPSPDIKEYNDRASELEYENSGWSTDDIPQSLEQSMYDNRSHRMIKSSLPDLLESSTRPLPNHETHNLMSMNYNKSTDLDEILELELSPQSRESTKDRLSQSLCNLFTTPLARLMKPRDTFQEITSLDNLLETDLDSGFVSVYKPAINTTELSPKVKFSSSMGNVSHVTCQAPLINKLRQKAGSVTELRIAESLTKLNIPTWLRLHDADHQIKERSCHDNENNPRTLPVIRSPIYQDRIPRTSQRKVIQNVPIIKPKPTLPVILPSQILRQNSQRKLTPINGCKARQFLLPNRITINNLNEPIKLTC